VTAPRQSKHSFKRFIFKTSFIFSFIGFVVIYWAATNAYQHSVKNTAVEASKQLAHATFNSMFQLMKQGWTRTQMTEFLTEVSENTVSESYQIQIYRAKKVEALFGEIPQPAFDKFLENVVSNKSSKYELIDNELRFGLPLLATSECLQCHRNAVNGDILGIIEIKQNLDKLSGDASAGLIKNLIYLFPIPFLLSAIVMFFLNRRINQSISHLEENIEKVNTVADLGTIELANTQLGFSEFNRVLSGVDQLKNRMLAVAVDRDLLEFEINLLEKFVITSDVVRDWREYINTLLCDINTVMVAYNLFSIFKVDDEVFALEIFWFGPPSVRTKALMEQEIKKSLLASPMFDDLASLDIKHNVSGFTNDEVDLDMETIQLQTKSMFMPVPKIGGIVGIGVHSEIRQDENRRLVMESILSTLMNVVGSVRAIYKYTKDIEYYATRDPLTDLHNQRIFWELLNYEVLRAKRHNYTFGVLMVDIDNFKAINDSFGHNFGDQFLQQFAGIMRKASRAGDMVSRYGGDEFMMILPETNVTQLKSVSDRIILLLEEMSIKTPAGDALDISVSIGMAVFPDHAQNAKDLFMFSNNMMYKAKEHGKNQAYIPSHDDVIEVFKDLSEKSILISKAIKEKNIVPYFQPMLGIESGKIETVEVLSRIQLSDSELMGAHEFIEIAENMGMIHLLDFVVMEKAFARINQEQFEGLIFLNMSPRSLVMNEFITTVKGIADKAGIDPSRVVFEITERDTVKNLSLLQKFVINLKQEGFLLAIDDFGSGFSSFHYLKHFPIDFVKIEGEFVANMVSNDVDQAVVRCIAGLAHELKAKTIAEFVESEEVLDAVSKMNVTYAQGYHVRRPAPYIFEHNK
jgi:diguanylate cyclase (GGDEF)-like protein